MACGILIQKQVALRWKLLNLLRQTPAANGCPDGAVRTSRLLRLVIVTAPLYVTIVALIFHSGWAARTLVALALGVAIASPVYGLMLATAVAPFGALLATTIHDEGFRISEAVVVAFLVGWLLRERFQKRDAQLGAPPLAWLFAFVVLVSMATLAWQLHAFPREFSAEMRQLRDAYFETFADWTGVVAGARLIEGLGLVAATVSLSRRDSAIAYRLSAVLAGSAAIAAGSSVLLWYGIGSASALQRLVLNGYRVSGHVGDANAAGSYFAMVLCLALGATACARGRSMAAWAMLTMASGTGLWLAQSRTAIAMVGILGGAALAIVVSARLRPRARAALLATAVIVGAGVTAARVRQLEKDPDFHGAGFRVQFFETSLRMIRASPLIGVGIGQYPRASPLYLSPQLAFAYGVENAHNYFLQIAAETGVVGFGAFTALLGIASARAIRALVRTPDDVRLLGITSGVLAFLGTCLSGHPLLVAEVAYPFWIQFGLMTASRSAAPDAPPAAVGLRRSAWWLTLAGAAGLVVVGAVTTPRRARAPVESQPVDGFYGWERAEDGRRFRWTGQFASVLLPKEVVRVRIPVRIPTDRTPIAPIGIDISTDGDRPVRTLVYGAWNDLDVRLREADPMIAVRRVNLRVERTWQPALYVPGSAEMRHVGIQVGEPEIIQTR
jgi:O-antigen ligase